MSWKALIIQIIQDIFLIFSESFLVTLEDLQRQAII